MSCETYEIAIEQRHRGALGTKDAEGLALHVPSCSSCQSFINLIQTMEKTMQAHTTNSLNTIDWNTISDGIHGWRRDITSGLWKGALAGVLALSLCLLLGNDLSDPVSIIGGASGLLAVLVLNRSRTRQLLAELDEAERSEAELIDVYRSQLDRQIKLTRQNAWVLPPISLLGLYLLPDEPATVNLLALGVFVCVFCALAARERFITLPKLQRSRAELD